MKRFILTGLLVSLVFIAACSKSVSTDTKGHGDHGEHAAAGGDTASDATKAVWKLSAAKPQAGAKTTVSVQVQDKQGKPVQKFDVNHEKTMHLIIVSKDLSYFDHIHPEYKGDGRFDIDTQFPAGGDYKLFADYVPTGGAATTKSEWISAEGKAPAAVPIAADGKLVKSVNGT